MQESPLRITAGRLLHEPVARERDVAATTPQFTVHHRKVTTSLRGHTLVGGIDYDVALQLVHCPHVIDLHRSAERFHINGRVRGRRAVHVNGPGAGAALKREDAVELVVHAVAHVQVARHPDNVDRIIPDKHGSILHVVIPSHGAAESLGNVHVYGIELARRRCRAAEGNVGEQHVVFQTRDARAAVNPLGGCDVTYVVACGHGYPVFGVAPVVVAAVVATAAAHPDQRAGRGYASCKRDVAVAGWAGRAHVGTACGRDGTATGGFVDVLHNHELPRLVGIEGHVGLVAGYVGGNAFPDIAGTHGIECPTYGGGVQR